MNVLLDLHILGGSVAIVAGYAALFAPKGQWLHRRAGMIFVVATIAMGVGAMVVGLARDLVTWTGGPTVIYFAITALTTVRPVTANTRRLDAALIVIPLSIGITRLVGGVQVAMSPGGTFQGIPAPVIILTSIVLLLAAAGDIRVLRSGPLRGTRRLARHLWRMCYATFVATSSFFLGQPNFIPGLLRDWPTRIILAFLPLVLLFYWLWRVRRRRGVTLIPGTPVRPAMESAR